jgi:hypothetical protein
MKVEFSPEEVHTMLEAILDEVSELRLDKHDKAAVRRWIAEEMTPGSLAVERLGEKVNAELQQSFARSEASVIKKPDWA